MTVKRMEGNVYYAVATKAVEHGLPCIEDDMAGVAVKEKVAPAATPLLTLIEVDEPFKIIVKGVVEVPLLSGAVVSDDLHITDATNVLTETSAGGTSRFGRVVGIEGDEHYATPAGRMTVDLDSKIND